jgi:hypothetical protein
MKNLTVIIILVFLSALTSGCSAREYHRYKISNTLTASGQNYHIQALRELEYGRNMSEKQSFPLGMGAFTTSSIVR